MKNQEPRTLNLNLPDYARVWVYQCDRQLNEAEITFINESSAKFISTWAAHGAKLNASIDVLHHQFIVIAVDEAQAEASGCSIDKSFQFIQQLEKQLNVSFLNRMLITYKEGQVVKTCSLTEFENLIKTGTITAETIVFNNLVSTLGELKTNWEVSVKQSWHSRYL